MALYYVVLVLGFIFTLGSVPHTQAMEIETTQPNEKEALNDSLFARIPNEIYPSIFQHLDRGSFINARNTCKLWNRISRPLPRALFLSICTSKHPDRALSYFEVLAESTQNSQRFSELAIPDKKAYASWFISLMLKKGIMSQPPHLSLVEAICQSFTEPMACLKDIFSAAACNSKPAIPNTGWEINLWGGKDEWSSPSHSFKGITAIEGLENAVKNNQIFISNITSVYINNIPFIPSTLLNFRYISSLNITASHRDKFLFLPENIDAFHRLTTLRLDRTSPFKFPANLSNLTKLVTLSLQAGHFKELPAPVLDLTQLRHLDLADNYLEEIPAKLLKFTQLDTLSLAGPTNTLSKMSISSLSWLPFTIPPLNERVLLALKEQLTKISGPKDNRVFNIEVLLNPRTPAPQQHKGLKGHIPKKQKK